MVLRYSIKFPSLRDVRGSTLRYARREDGRSSSINSDSLLMFGRNHNPGFVCDDKERLQKMLLNGRALLLHSHIVGLLLRFLFKAK